MKFFESPMVLESIEEIDILQQEVLEFSLYADYANLEQQRDNLNLLKVLMGKQQLMCFRCILSDDSDAKALLAEVLAHFQQYGHDIDPENPMKVFTEVERQLQEMEDDLDYADKHGYFPGEEPGGETPPSTMF